MVIIYTHCQNSSTIQ